MPAETGLGGIHALRSFAWAFSRDAGPEMTRVRQLSVPPNARREATEAFPLESHRPHFAEARVGRLEISSALRRIFSNSDVLVTRGARDYSLDGVRAVAALWVFAAHATYLNLMPSILNFRGAGRAGVVLFFFLSAFLISGPFFHDPRKALTWQAWTTYGLRRLFRIVPLYFAVLLALFCADIEPLNRSTLSANAHLLARHLTFQKGLSVFWTIIVEMRFYVVLPLLLIVSALVLEKLKNGRFVLMLTGCLWIAGVVTGVIQHGYLRQSGNRRTRTRLRCGSFNCALLLHVKDRSARPGQQSSVRVSRMVFRCRVRMFVHSCAVLCDHTRRLDICLYRDPQPCA